MIRSVGALKNVWKIPDLRRKLLYTLMILFAYRIGAVVPAPFIDRDALAKFIDDQRRAAGGSILQVIDLFSGRAFSQMSIFALGIMPYISVSIILQLLAMVVPRLQKLQQEGALGQRKINRMTRQFTVLLALFQSLALGMTLQNQGLTYLTGAWSGVFLFSTIIAMTTGTTLLMWMGERITDNGIGNGISLIIAVGIIAQFPSDAWTLVTMIRQGSITGIWGIFVPLLFVASAMAIILVQEGMRRIPIQHAKQGMVGKKFVTSGSNYLPLKINVANVIPVIFASALLALPTFIDSVLTGGSTMGAFGNFFSQTSSFNPYTALGENFQMGGAFLLLKSINPYIVTFAVLTAFFCFFYTAVAFNPDDLANNLKKNGSFVPGKRPGKPTSEYIDFVLTRITTVGALFLVTIAIVPMVLQTSYGMPIPAMTFVGGTGLIIVIGVLLDALKQVESQLLMRHYEGFAMRRTSMARRR